MLLPTVISTIDNDGVPLEDELAMNIVRGTASLSANKVDLKFRPGILPVNNIETLKLCYTDTAVYKTQLGKSRLREVVRSEDHKLIYVRLRKSGSSTGHIMMENKFGAHQQLMDLTAKKVRDHYNVFTFIRDPLHRFYSQYDEAYSRTSPWRNGFRKEDGYTHPAAFIYEGFNSKLDYDDAFCPPETRKKRGECSETRENGTLAARFERYVWEYDGRSPFDPHLDLQVPYLSIPDTGRAFHVDEIYNITIARVGWEALAKKYHVDLSDGRNDIIHVKNKYKGDGVVIRARLRPRQFNVEFVTDRTKQRICELGMLDYCCLNLPLPPPCENLYCRMDKEDDNGSPRIRIQPWSFPQSRAADYKLPK
jgi:hypothetical protein